MLKKTILGGLSARSTAWSGLAILSAAALLASGCGQKGPLFIQPPAPAAAPKPAATPTAQPAAAPAAADKTQPANSGTAR